MDINNNIIKIINENIKKEKAKIKKKQVYFFLKEKNMKNSKYATQEVDSHM